MTPTFAGVRLPDRDPYDPEGAVVNAVHEQLAREHRHHLRGDAHAANMRRAVLAARRLDRRARLADRRARAARAALAAMPLR